MTHHPSCLARIEDSAECICPTTKRRRLPRKTAVVVGVLALVSVAGVAFALYLLKANVGGNLTANKIEVAWMGAATKDASSTAATCSATNAGGGAPLMVEVAGYPGDTCYLKGQLYLKSGAAEDARITGLSMTLPSGWKAKLMPGTTCGAFLPKAGTPVEVGIVFTVPSSATSGQLVASADGVTLLPRSQDPAAGGAITCPELVG